MYPLINEEKERNDIKDVFKQNYHIYKQPLNMKQERKRGAKKMEHKWSEVNKENERAEVILCMKEGNTKRAIMAILLSRYDKLMTIQDIKTALNFHYPTNLTDAACRGYFTNILKTDFGKYYINVEENKGKANRYVLNPIYKNKFSIDMAMSEASIYPKRKKKVKETEKASEKPQNIQEKNKQKLASFDLNTSMGKIEINVFGKIQIEFSFK